MKSKKTQRHKINAEVRFPSVRLVGFYDEPKIMSSYEASKIAESEQLDLILINENQEIPIVKIADYGKFLYDLEKSEKEKKKNSVKFTLKEIQLSPDISSNDLNTKIKKGIELLQDGDKVRCVLMMRGRQNASPERSEVVMLKYANGVEEAGIPESMPKLEGKKWIMILKPRKK